MKPERLSSRKKRLQHFNKAQLQMAETMFVLVIFMFILIFGVVIYVKIQGSFVERSSIEARQLKAIQLAQNIKYLPEFQCTKSGALDYNCIDFHKVTAIGAVMSANPLVYERIFYDSNIDIVVIYGQYLSGQWTINIYNKKPEFVKRSSEFRVPVTLFNSTAEEYYFGYLNITLYS